MQSCIYRGHVRHRRFAPLKNNFRYPIAYLYVDLAELPEVVAKLPLLSMRPRWSVASLCREDHLGDLSLSLDEAVRQRVAEETGKRPDGPIRMLTLWRTFGRFFSPVNFFFCFAPDSDEVESVVAEVNNTPWREQHCYVLWEGNRRENKSLAFANEKVFHVSPFMALDLHYRWSFSNLGSALSIHIEATRDQECELDATLSLRRVELSSAAWLAQVVRYPMLPARLITAIYYQALKLWIRKAPFYPHPSKRPTDPAPAPASVGPKQTN